MADPMKGVRGVLGNLVSPEPVSSPPVEPEVVPDGQYLEQPSPEPESPSSQLTLAPKSPPSRKGRPPGPRAGEPVVKEKVTLRIDKALMDAYRDWSWEERCQIGELVERALIQYRRQQTRRPTK